ncbi:MAG: DUF790 family protein [Myxococcota bacterium]
MLTRDLLLFSMRKGRVRPKFLDRADKALQPLAEAMVGLAEEAPGRPKREIDEALSALALGAKKPKVARGLVKLLTDRLEVAEPDEAVAEKRNRAFEASMSVLRSVSPEMSAENFAETVAAEVGVPLDKLREDLHADLPEARPILAFDALDAAALLDRYDLALAQGLVLHARAITLDLPPLGRPEVRRVLRFMRFCRLVATADRARLGDELRLTVDGPAALFEGAKSYGLQLASFLTVVPTLPKWRLEAEVRLPRRAPATLELTDADPLTGRFAGGAGHVPDELRAAAEGLSAPGWTVDLAPSPRTSGATGVRVPDFALVADDGRRLEIELFHRFHRGALHRRLDELEEHPEPELRLGIDRSLVKDPSLAARCDDHPQVFLFRGFPTQRALKKILSRPPVA